jgi:peptidoglycan/LPS O-acetylase OafA/YrhL
VLGVAGLISKIGRATQILALVGTYSYGIFLIHQPYVIWLGFRVRPLPFLVFLFLAVR